jgi:hypothetical protein
MQTQTIESYLNHKKGVLSDAQIELDTIERLASKYSLSVVPLLGLDHVLVSGNVNSIVDKVWFTYAIDSDPDVPTFAAPYVEIEGIKIFSDPCCFTLVEIPSEEGESVEGLTVPWSTKMLAAGIPEALVQRISEKLPKSGTTLSL